MTSIHSVPSDDEDQADAASAAKGDVYDNLDRLRNHQLPDVTARKPLTSVPVVHRPRQFFRTNPNPAYSLPVKILVWGPSEMDTEIYLLDPDVWEALEDEKETRDAQLFLTVDPDNNPAIWPVKLPRDTDGRGASWAESALEKAEEAKHEWIKIHGDKATGRYVSTVAEGELGEPTWPTDERGVFSFGQLLRKAFGKKYYIDSLDHFVVGKIKGR